MGVTQKAYSKIETGETKLTVQHLLQIADILEVEMNELLEKSNKMDYLNHQTRNGERIVINESSSDNSKELYEKLIASKEREIDILHKYVARLEKGE
jgi:transcriptional regulator with XRE-family HTH domain